MVSERSISFVLYYGTIISGVLALVIVVVPIVAPIWVNEYNVPDTVENWGGVVLGFYFGSFISQVASFVRSVNRPNERSRAGQGTTRTDALGKA